MKIIEHLDHIIYPLKNAVVTIGNFDGVHLGHQALFHQVIERSLMLDGTAAAITFEPHPLRVIKQNGYIPLITLYEQKTELIARTGIDVLICIPFTLEFAAISAKTFIKSMLVEQIGMKSIIVGKDYTFGRNREGTVELLESFSRELGFEVVVSDWIQAQPEVQRISSTMIRSHVLEGRMAMASKLLGRHYQIRGRVEKGRNRGGKLLGFPTANIRLTDELAPKQGVYAVTVECAEQRYLGVANIGYSPTFDDHIYTVEVHILEFNRHIYDEQIRVNFVERIRDERKFSGIAELSEQISRDIVMARSILKTVV